MTVLRVATWNVRTCLTREGDRVDLDLTAAVLRSLDADLVALQEIDRDQERSGHVDQARALGEALGMAWRFAPALLGQAEPPRRWRPPEPAGDPGGPAYGVALLSRVELEAVETFVLPLPEGRGEPRVALVARVRAGVPSLSVASTHLSFVRRDGVRQLRSLQRHLAGSRGSQGGPGGWGGSGGPFPAPRLLLGDLNLWLPVVRLVSLPGWRPLVRGATFPNHPPGSRGTSVQIDHVLAAGAAGVDLRVRRTRIAASPVSDHRAVVVSLELAPRPDQAGRSNQAW
jgi:endonuclease/exonuclease/phosphatase family metal-dependent hydrolase